MTLAQNGHFFIAVLTTPIKAWKVERAWTLLLVIICFLSVAISHNASAASVSGQFVRILSELQRHGSCRELPQLGVSTHRGRNSDDINVGLATEVGAKVVRFDITWADVEKDGKFQFRNFDYLIQRLRQKNISIVLLLAYGHPDHTDHDSAATFPFLPRTPEQRQAYFRYVRATVEHFHGPDITYEVWNEPNLKLFWPSADAATDYAELLEGTARTIREVDPMARVLAAGMANTHDRNSFVNKMIAATNMNQVDAVAFHPYREDGPENSLLDISEFGNASAKDGHQLPIWLTEWGYSEVWLARKYPRNEVRDRHATMIARLLLTAAISKAKAAIIYDLIDDGFDPNDPESKFGLYDYEFHPKNAARAFRTLANLMSHCENYSFEFDPVRKIITAVFQEKSHISHVIWTYDSRHNQEICFNLGSSNATHLLDIFGQTLPFEFCPGSSNIKLKISENAGPLILTTDR
jgi:hypothetical protein